MISYSLYATHQHAEQGNIRISGGCFGVSFWCFCLSVLHVGQRRAMCQAATISSKRCWLFDMPGICGPRVQDDSCARGLLFLFGLVGLPCWRLISQSIPDRPPRTLRAYGWRTGSQPTDQLPFIVGYNMATTCSLRHLYASLCQRGSSYSDL